MLVLLIPLVAAAELKTGDIAFHESRSSQSAALKAATHSRYTHMGLVVVGPEGTYVVEAVQPVRRTPWAQWVARGAGGHVVVKRLVEPLTPTQTTAVVAAAEQMLGRPYDLAFLWDDDAIYCSELVWKAYERGAGVRLGEPRRFSDFDLRHPEVREKMAERHPAGLPADEPVVAPADIHAWPGLELVLTQD
jgi:uncharacterized protein YycO